MYILYSIGYAIARRLGLDGASVMISSRRQQNVQQAVEKLKEEKINVAGVVCHVGKQDDRTQLIQEVDIYIKTHDSELLGQEEAAVCDK